MEFPSGAMFSFPPMTLSAAEPRLFPIKIQEIYDIPENNLCKELTVIQGFVEEP
jgi:hypothetical protein